MINSALSPEKVLSLMDQPAERSQDPRAVLLAHNLLIWARRWLTLLCPKIAKFGRLRLVRARFR